MRETLAWAVPLLVSLLVIQLTAEFLAVRAASQADRAPVGQTTTGKPVHEVESAVTERGIIT